jgi:DNA sulfur modification protein DndE
LIKERCMRDGISLTERELGRQFRLHLHRGIGYLATPGYIHSISALAKLAMRGEKAAS